MRIARTLREGAVDEIWAALQGSAGPEQFSKVVESIVQEPQNLLELPFDTSDLPDLKVSGDRASAEFDNSVAIYEALGALPKVAAADERLWTYLALGPWRSYMEDRWPLASSRSWKTRAQDRWLMKSATYGTLIRHGIARLWWLADMTFDPQMNRTLSAREEDPWAYLRVAVAAEDRILAIFDRDVGLIPELRFALLELCAERGDLASEGWLRHLMKEVTLTYGYRDLTALPPGLLRLVLHELDRGEASTAST